MLRSTFLKLLLGHKIVQSFVGNYPTDTSGTQSKNYRKLYESDETSSNLHIYERVYPKAQKQGSPQNWNHGLNDRGFQNMGF